MARSEEEEEEEQKQDEAEEPEDTSPSDSESSSEDRPKTGLNPNVEDYLKQLSEQRQNMQSPDYQGALASLRNAQYGGDMAPQRIAAYGQALAQLGTLGGKAPNAAPLNQYSQNIQQEQNAQNQREQKDDAEQDKQTGLYMKTLQFLEDKKRRENEALAQRTAVAQNLQDKLQAQAERASDRNAMMAMNQANLNAYRASQGDQKTEAAADKRFGEFGKALNEGLASSRSDMGKQQGIYSAADRVMALGEQAKYQAGGLDPRQIHEMAIASANLVSGGGSGAAQSTIENLVPQSAQGSVAKLEEWLTSAPHGTNQQEFVNRMLETAQREKFLASEKIKTIKSNVVQSYADLEKKNPDRYSQVIASNFGDNAQFDKNNKYVMQTYKPPQDTLIPQANTAYAGTPAQDKPSAPPPGKVRVISPDGQTGFVDQEKLSAAKARGFKEAP